MSRDNIGELTPIEKNVVSLMRQLNPYGQSIVLETTDNLTYSDRCRAKCTNIERWKRDHPAPRPTCGTHTVKGGVHDE